MRIRVQTQDNKTITALPEQRDFIQYFTQTTYVARRQPGVAPENVPRRLAALSLGSRYRRPRISLLFATHSLGETIPYCLKQPTGKMRVITTVALATTLITVLLLRCCEGASLRFSMPEDDEDFRLRPMYRDYGLIRNRQIRADDVFDDYGHLRFGRSHD